MNRKCFITSGQHVGSVTRKKSSDFHGGIRFQSSFTIRRELEDKNFLRIDIIDSLKYRIMAIKTNENFIHFSNSVTFRKPRGTDLVTASELIPGIPGFCAVQVKCPDPGVDSHDQKRDRGIVSGIKSPPLTRTPPPPPISLNEKLSEVQLLRLRATFHALPLFYLHT